jgi:hypothetical protein
MQLHLNTSTSCNRDKGTVLPLVLVMSVVVSMVVVSLAGYITTALRYGNVVEERADRLAAADGGLRYAVERLQNSAYAGCLTTLGATGYSIDFPVQVNGADVDVTCRKGSNGAGDIKSWAVIVTGEGVPANPESDGWMWKTQGGNGLTKLLGGPVWVSDPGRDQLGAPVKIEDGDLWYYRADCENPSTFLDVPGSLDFAPAYRGPICVEETWDTLFLAPTVGSFAPVTDAPNPPYSPSGTCRVFEPGRYTTMPSLAPNTYFKSGNYYFEDFTFDVTNATVTAGWPDFSMWGDQQFIANTACDVAIAADADPATGSTAGATFYLGGTAKIEIGNHGSLEITRRLQGDTLLSIQTLDTTTVDHKASSLDDTDNVVWTKSGDNHDLAIHGLLWAPRAQFEFGNVTNAANGQLLGGIAVSRLVLQASASTTGFIIRVATAPIAFQLRIDSLATLNGLTTLMTAIVDVDDQGTTAINSLRVVE